MNVKIDSGNIKQLQKSLLEIQKIKNAEFKKELHEQKQDLKQISSDSINLKNLDAETSTLNQNNQSIDFNLVFNFFPAIQIFAEGKINREENSLEIYFKHKFQREVYFDGIMISREFLLELRMKASFGECKPEENRFERVDILKFIERLAFDIFDSFNDNSNSLRALVINEKHLDKIASAEKNELVSLIQSLLGSVFSFIKYKEAGGKNARFYHPKDALENKEYFVKEIESISLEIKLLDKEPKAAAELLSQIRMPKQP